MNKITIIDYGLGNLASVGNALKKLEIPYQISGDIDVIENATALILPGVGAAGEVMKNLIEKGLDEVIIKKAKKGTPLFGVCLGMQLLLSTSEEGNVKCLGLIKGGVKKFKTNLKVPQIGWNQVKIKNYESLQFGGQAGIMEKGLFKNVQNNSFMYFANSYYCVPDDKVLIAAETDYDEKFCSALIQDNIAGVQFHPEKSGDVGLQLLKNFWEEIC